MSDDLFDWAGVPDSGGDGFPPGLPRDVCLLFERLAVEISGRGWKRYSSDAILHRIRWHHHIERGDRAFKANDHWTATLSRWFMNRHPELEGFFETRSSPHGGDEEDRAA